MDTFYTVSLARRQAEPTIASLLYTNYAIILVSYLLLSDFGTGLAIREEKRQQKREGRK